MCAYANAYTQMSLLKDVPLGNVLYAREEGKKIVYYTDRECTTEWARADDSRWLRETLNKEPAFFIMNDGFTYTMERVVWV